MRTVVEDRKELFAKALQEIRHWKLHAGPNGSVWTHHEGCNDDSRAIEVIEFAPLFDWIKKRLGVA